MTKNNSVENKQKDTIRACNIPIKIREEEGEFYSEGFICTTHPDRAQEDGFENTMLSKRCIEQIADSINNGVAGIDGIGATRAVSLKHDWIKEGDPHKEPAGMAVPPVEVRETGDGHWGVYGSTHHNKNHPEFEQTVYNVKHGYLPGYSVEFKEGEVEAVNVQGRSVKFIKSIIDFVGYAFASARLIANPKALISSFAYREVEENMEVSQMTDEEVKKTPEAQETPKEKVVEEKKEEVKSEEVKEETKTEEVKEEPQVKEVKINARDIAKEITKSKEFKDSLSKIQVKEKVLNTGEGETMKGEIRIREMNEAITKSDLYSFNNARSNYIADNGDWALRELQNPENFSRGFKSNLKVHVREKGLVISGDISMRGTLDTATNESTYTQQPVEFADIFQPGIIDTFNTQTTLFGFLRKEQWIGGMYYQFKTITSKDPLSNDTFVDRDDVTVAKQYANKQNLQTPLKLARRGISVTDFTLKYSAPSLGDLFQKEVDIQMTYMMKEVNKALFAEVADGTGSAPLGLEAVADSDGNTTLYGLTRSTTNRLSPDTATDTYTAISGSITEAYLRRPISYLEGEGTRKGDIAYVCSPKGREYIFNILDGNRRYSTTETKFGFNDMTVPTYDGHPIIVDSDCTSAATTSASASTAIFIIDQETDVIAIGMEPKLVGLAKVGAATETYLEFHFAHVYKQPRRISMIDSITGPAA